MKIDWIITELNVQGGAENYLRRVVPYLCHAGYDLRVITLIPGGSIVDELRHEGVQVIELGLRSKTDWISLMRLRKIWYQNKPDLVHTHLFHAGLVGRIIARSMDIQPVIVHQHGIELARSSSRSLIDRISSPLVNQYVATCHEVANIMQKREGISKTKITVIYNGVDVNLIQKSIPQPSKIRRPQLFIACVGRLSPEKGHLTLLKALSRINTRVYDVQILLIGDGELKSIIAARSSQPDLNGRVHLLGVRYDVLEQLANVDIFVLPSNWEGISMALLEAMATGLPVVATSVGGTPEVVVDGETGFLVPPRDSEALAAALSRLIEDSSLRQRMGQAGQQRVLTMFNIQNTIQQTQSLYEKFYSMRHHGK